jgi:hypothetical protein
MLSDKKDLDNEKHDATTEQNYKKLLDSSHQLGSKSKQGSDYI